MPSSIIVSISERAILKVILEFLENHNFYIAQLSLERETGVINGEYSEDLLFLRQLIIDGQWDNAIDFVTPLKDIPDFDMRSFCYFVNKYKYYELLCIKQEPGPMYDNDFAVEEIVECLKELEHLCPSAEEFRRLCALLTLNKLSDHEDLKVWNPSSARMECFYKVLPLVLELLNNASTKKSNINDNAVNDRLIQLLTKGILYEAAVDHCQNQALDGKNAAHPQSKFTNILLPKPKLSPADLSLISWLEVLGNEQFTIPFQQKNLDFKVESLKKPILEAQWAEQILAAPIKPGGQFPHSLVPNSKLKCAQKMSQSLILPSMKMSTPIGPEYLRMHKLSAMSHSTTAALSKFTINVKTLNDESSMRQSQVITNMLENVSEAKITPQFYSQSSGISTNSMVTSYSSCDNNSRTTALSYPRRELDAICRRNKSVPPSSLKSNCLPPVPELSTPTSAALIVDSVADKVKELDLTSNIMINSKLFQEFSSKYTKLSTLNEYNAVNRNMNSVAMECGNIPFQQCISQQVSNSTLPMCGLETTNTIVSSSTRPHSFTEEIPPSCFKRVWDTDNIYNCGSTINCSNLNISQNIRSDATYADIVSYNNSTRNNSNDKTHPIEFVPLCRYEDSQAIRAVTFHPSGKFFVIGTNSKQMHICKYPDIRESNTASSHEIQSPEILLSRPKQHRGSVYCCGFNQSGELLATGSNDKTIRLMSFNAEECKIGAEMELTIHDGTVRELIFMESTISYSSSIISGGGGNCHICVTDCVNGHLFKSFTGHTDSILGLYSWGPGTSFVSCSQDKTVRFWDLRASSSVNVISPSIRSSNSPVTSVCVDPSGKLLVSGHEDASIMLYDIVGGRVVQIYRPHGDEVRTVRCSNAAYYLLSGSYDKRIIITDIRGDLTASLIYLPVAEHDDKIIQCRWHPQDFTFLSTSADRTAVLWSLPHQSL